MTYSNSPAYPQNFVPFKGHAHIQFAEIDGIKYEIVLLDNEDYNWMGNSYMAFPLGWGSCPPKRLAEFSRQDRHRLVNRYFLGMADSGQGQKSVTYYDIEAKKYGSQPSFPEKTIRGLSLQQVQNKIVSRAIAGK